MNGLWQGMHPLSVETGCAAHVRSLLGILAVFVPVGVGALIHSPECIRANTMKAFEAMGNGLRKARSHVSGGRLYHIY